MKKITLLAAASAFVLSSCASGSPEAGPVTVTATETIAAPTVTQEVAGPTETVEVEKEVTKTVTETVEVAQENLDTGAEVGGLSDAEIDMLSLEMAWEEMSDTEKDDICGGVDTFGVEFVADEYFSHADRDVVIDFFNGVC